MTFMQFLEKEEKKGEGFGCLMVYLDDGEDKDALLEMLENIDDDDLYGVDLDFGLEEDPHTTIKFGIHEQDHTIVMKEFEDIVPVTVSLDDELSLFENEDYDVLKIGVDGDYIRELNARACEGFECTDTHPKYNPHITLGYLLPGKGQEYVDSLEVPFDEVTFTKLCFSDAEKEKTWRNLTG